MARSSKYCAETRDARPVKADEMTEVFMAVDWPSVGRDVFESVLRKLRSSFHKNRATRC